MLLLLQLLLLSCIILSVAGMDTAPDGPRHEEIMIPMRDGIELHTMIYFPRGYLRNKDQKYTAIMDRSPYGYGDMEWITDIFLPFGFVAVGQDMRGTEKSQGVFTMWTQDKNDSQDLGNWITSQEWSNGQVMTIGASADGLAALQIPFVKQDFLTASYIAWSPAQMYKILLPHGTYKKELTMNWLHGLTMPDPDYVNTNIAIIEDNEAHTDFWAQIELTNLQYANVNWKNAFWGGWYDLFILGTLAAFEGYNEHSDESVRYTSKIVVDPLGHCLGSAEFFKQNTVEGRTGLAIAQMFEVFGIRPVTRDVRVKNVTFYVMSSNDEAGLGVGQYWTSMETFPKHREVDYYLHADKSASTSIPKFQDDDEKSTSYVYDPADPIPTMGGNNLPPDIGGSMACGPLDQAEVDLRDDVLTFQTEVFDDELALTGPITATLYVSSDAIDTDFMVRVSDVYPTGEVRLIQDNALRMRWRGDGVTPVYMEKGEVYEIHLNLWNTSYIVAPTHALRIAVSSSNNPRFSINYNNGLVLNDPLYPGVNVTATNTIYHSYKYPSKVTLPVVSKYQLPEIHALNEVQKMYPQITDDVVKKFSKGMLNNMGKQFRSVPAVPVVDETK